MVSSGSIPLMSTMIYNLNTHYAKNIDLTWAILLQMKDELIKYNNMYNQSALIRIAKQLFPDKNVFQLTKQEQSQVLSIYNEFH